MIVRNNHYSKMTAAGEHVDAGGEAEEEEYQEDESTEHEDTQGDGDGEKESEEHDEGQEQSGDNDEIVVTIGDENPEEEPEEAVRPWVRELRKKARDDARKIRDLEEQVRQASVGTQSAPKQLVKPTLESCDYDEAAYEIAVSAWVENKRDTDAREASAKKRQQDEAREWQDKLSNYEQAKKTVRIANFEDAEEVVISTLSKTQQGIILQGSANPVLLISAIGRNPAKAQELAKIEDPIKYAFAIAKIESEMKVTKRKPPPPESGITKSTGSLSGSKDSGIERLRAKAEKTGDYTELMQYKQRLKAKK